MKELINKEMKLLLVDCYGKSFYGGWYANFIVTSFEVRDYVTIRVDTLQELKVKIKQKWDIDFELDKEKRNDHI